MGITLRIAFPRMASTLNTPHPVTNLPTKPFEDTGTSTSPPPVVTVGTTVRFPPVQQKIDEEGSFKECTDGTTAFPYREVGIFARDVRQPDILRRKRKTETKKVRVFDICWDPLVLQAVTKKRPGFNEMPLPSSQWASDAVMVLSSSQNLW